MLQLGKGKLIFDFEKKLTDKLSFVDDDIPSYVKSIHRPFSADAEASFEIEVDARSFMKLTGDIIPRDSSFDVLAKTPYQVQIRKHKKKRINKKWAKRYGYLTKFKMVKMDGVTFTNIGSELSFTGMLNNSMLCSPYVL